MLLERRALAPTRSSGMGGAGGRWRALVPVPRPEGALERLERAADDELRRRRHLCGGGRGDEGRKETHSGVKRQLTEGEEGDSVR